MPMALLRDFDIFWTPSRPSRIGRHEDDLGLLAGIALQVAATHEVEFLVGAAEFDVSTSSATES